MNSMHGGFEPDRRGGAERPGPETGAADGGAADDGVSRSDDSPTFDQLLDRLVDGELVGAEYRQFVQSFDARPDGWRRCGLAFLEAQAWRQDFIAVRSSESLEARPVDAGAARGQAGASGGRGGRDSGRDSGGIGGGRFGWGNARSLLRWSALAASWMLALGLGAWWMDSTADRGPSRAEPSRQGVKPPPLRSLAAPAMRPYQPTGDSPTPNRDEVEFLLVGDHGDWQESKRLPVLSPEQHARESSPGQRPPETDVLELLRRSGTDVTRREEYVPYVLPDGRQILLPIERVEVKPARRPAY